MKINEKLHGFTVNKITEIDEISAVLVEMTHKKSGAKLNFLDREDENKTFSIAFKTIPEDSTGVFHIIEHSVLCGSEKYPVKEPFVELLKGSLNTFLNAMTFPDKTMYPVASRNDKDFLNLISVYLDAVLHPAILTNPNIFRQEGWHYELDGEDGVLTRSGVVLNEMKGAFSSPDELAGYHITNMLYADTCYSYESGGKPDVIPELTYDAFLEAHKKYYHPSNSEIFLDGSVDLDAALSLIDSFLAPYDAVNMRIDIPDQKPLPPQRRVVEYEIAEGESPENKTRLELGYMFSSYSDQESVIAASILLDAICSSNESPLKKALLNSGLCEDVGFIPYDSVKQNSITVDFRNVKDGRCDELYELFVNTVRKLAADGIDKNMLTASLNSSEFKSREKNYGTLPHGIIYAMSVLESSLYGGDPAQNLSFGKSYASIRQKLNGDYFEKLLLSLFADNTHMATLIMTPSATLGKENAKRDAEALEKIKSSMSDEELKDIIDTDRALKEWQKTPDSEDGLKTIPALAISDIKAEVERIPQDVSLTDGVTTLTHNISTNGITYSELIFDITDLDENDIFDLRLLNSLLINVDTESYTALELQNKIKGELGSFGVSTLPITRDGKTKYYLVVSASALDSQKNFIPVITKEVLYTSVYTNKEVIKNIVRQMKIASEESFVSSGHLAAFRRASAYSSVESTIDEYYSGYEAHLKIKELDKSFDEVFDSLSLRLKKLSERIFTKERVIASLTGEPDPEFIRTLLSTVRCSGTFDPSSSIKPLGIRREGILIPAQVGYASVAMNLDSLNEKFTGSLNVTRSLLSYDYLWNAVRVQGGAYGVGLIARIGGNVGFYSYRDPSPARTVGCYLESADFLRRFAESDEDITKFIIGAVGDTSPLTSPMLKGAIARSRFLRGIDYEAECKARREIIETDAKELIRIADIIDKVTNSNAVCIVGGREQLDAASDIIDTVLEI